MDALSLYAAEAARRRVPVHGAYTPPPITLDELARRAGITRRAVLVQLRQGALGARRVAVDGRRWRWEVDAAEAERWRQQYRKHARVGRANPSTRARAAA